MGRFSLAALVVLGACGHRLPPAQEAALEARFPDARLDDAALCARLAAAGPAPRFDDPEPRLRRKVLISDLHLGPGEASRGRFRGLEDFRYGRELERLLDRAHAAGPTDLVIAGDFLEIWQVLGALDLLPGRDDALQAGAPAMLAADQASAVKAVDAIVAAHRSELAALGRFLGRGDHRVIILPGNHDADLLWPRVQLALARAIAPAEPARLLFVPAAAYRHGGVHVEHGHRFDGANRPMLEHGPFARDARGRCRLLASWGQVFVARFFNHTEQQFPFVDNLFPESATLLWALEEEPDKLALAHTAGRFIDLLVSAESRSLNLAFLGSALSSALGLPMARDGVGHLPRELGRQLVERFSNQQRLLEGIWALVSDPGLQRVAAAITAAAEAMPDTRAALLALARISPEDLAVLRVTLFGDPLENAARDVLSESPDVAVVVFGHTHLPGGAVLPVESRAGRGHYANTGCWIPVANVEDLKRRGVAWSALTLEDRKIFPTSFPEVTVEYRDGRPLPPRLGQASDPGTL